jgi:ribosome biogenesis GTPase
MAIGTQVHITSGLTGDGLIELRTYFRNHATVALLGSSGVGKSTLINALAGSALQDTAEVRGDGKGRHTTTHRQLLIMPDGGLIIDTPGMRELQLWESQTGFSDTFGDIDELATDCRFVDCRHAGEPGCAVADAIKEGRLSEDRFKSYQKLQRELAHLERKQDARAQSEEKRRIKGIMKSLRHHPKYK